MQPRALLAATAALTVASAVSAQTFNLVNTVNIDSTAGDANPEFIGSNPIAVAFDAGRLFVAGFNGSGAIADVGIVEVLNPLAAGTPTYGTVFGQSAAPGNRGFTGLDISDAGLAAAFDNGGASSGGLRQFALDGTPDFSFRIRGFSGTAYDPGFNGGGVAQGGGLGVATLGNPGVIGRLDPADGSVLFTQDGAGPQPTGFVYLPQTTPESSTLLRDFTFDPDTGDFYGRAANAVYRAERTGPNAVAAPVVLAGPNTPNVNADAAFTLGQNIDYISLDSGDLLVTNDRTGATVTFAEAVEFLDPITGEIVDVTLDGFDESISGNGLYDFSFDADTGTLAILDFVNRNVSIFELAGMTDRLPGDANNDGSVTIADFAILRANFGTTGSSFDMGDFNEDGSVTIADFAILRANFGSTVSSAQLAEADAWAASVPEPTTLGLVAAAGLGLVRRRR